MSPWALLTTCFAVSGCGGAVQAGLSNAPRLGDSQTDLRIDDATSNGADSCERRPAGPTRSKRADPNENEGPLRGHIPPCPTTSHPVAVTLVTESARSDSLVVPWLEHFYADWPCASSRHLSWTDVAGLDDHPGPAGPARPKGADRNDKAAPGTGWLSSFWTAHATPRTCSLGE
jgi:hypothetical protein